MGPKWLILLLLLILHPTAKSEYRAYELEISNVETEETRRVISTLDHIQYPGYYPLRKDEAIRYVDSWMCWGNTKNFKPICPKPEIDLDPTE